MPSGKAQKAIIANGQTRSSRDPVLQTGLGDSGHLKETQPLLSLVLGEDTDGAGLAHKPDGGIPTTGLVKPIRVPVHGDHRGSLVAIETDSGAPFQINRVYYIFDTRSDQVRGKHAHIKLKQLLLCVSGSCVVDVETADGHIESHTLNTPTEGLLIEGLVWREMRDFSPGAVLVVLADSVYDESDYIREYDAFKSIAAQCAGATS